MRIYETVLILRPDLPEEEIEATVEQMSAVIAEGGGTVDKVEKWGKRKLAYRVKRNLEGHYVLLNYSVPENTGLSKELERRLSVADPVIKYMTVRTDQELKRLEKIRKQREKRAAKKPPREAAMAPSAPKEPAEPKPKAPAAKAE